MSDNIPEFTDDDMYDDDTDYTITINDHINNITITDIHYYNYNNIVRNYDIYTYINNMIYNISLTHEQYERIQEYLSAFQ